MATEAARKGKAKYRRENVHKIVVDLYPKDEDIWLWWQSKENKQQWIRDKIREEIDKEVRHADEHGFPED